MGRVLACAAAVICLLGMLGARSARAETEDAVAASLASTAATVAFCATLAIASTDDASVDDEDYDRKGWLLRMAAAYGNLLRSSADDGFGIDAGAGYRCHSRVSSEVQVEWIDGLADKRSIEGFSPDARVSADPVTVTASTKAYILTGRFQPYLLLGLGAMTAEVRTKDELGVEPTSVQSRAEFAMRFGGGLDFYATENLVLDVGLGYVYPFGDLNRFDYLSVRAGAQYRF